MPNRIIKESICSSDTIDSLSWFEEVLFYRLIVNCDDYGRLDARPAILKAKLFPLKDRLSLKDVENALVKLVEAGCVMLYDCDSKPYLFLPAWEVHQRIRNKKSKYPDPGKGCCQSFDSELPSKVAVIQSNPNPNLESECMPGAKSAPATQPVITLTLNDKTEYPISQSQIEEWSTLYPAVDVMQQLRNMRGWIIANPTKRKTESGILRFITNWLTKEQNSGRCRRSNSSPSYDLEKFDKLGYDIPEVEQQ